MRADNLSNFFFPSRIAFAGDERGFIAERLCVKNRANLANGTSSFQRCDALHHFGFAEGKFFSHRRPRPSHHRNFSLNQT